MVDIVFLYVVCVGTSTRVTSVSYSRTHVSPIVPAPSRGGLDYLFHVFIIFVATYLHFFPLAWGQQLDKENLDLAKQQL